MGKKSGVRTQESGAEVGARDYERPSCNQELLPPYQREDFQGTPPLLVSIELPIGEFDERQRRPGHIEARLSPKQGRALQRVLNGLNAKYGQGWRRRDFGYADVVRYLLDQLPE